MSGRFGAHAPGRVVSASASGASAVSGDWD